MLQPVLIYRKYQKTKSPHSIFNLTFSDINFQAKKNALKSTFHCIYNSE